MTGGPHFPFHGTVVWLTPEQGGRRTGPPDVPDHRVYAANGWLPPGTADDALRSLVLRGFDGRWRSRAEARWLVEQEGEAEVVAGSVVVVGEGPRAVGFLLVDAVVPRPR